MKKQMLFLETFCDISLKDLNKILIKHKIYHKLIGNYIKINFQTKDLKIQMNFCQKSV